MVSTWLVLRSVCVAACLSAVMRIVRIARDLSGILLCQWVLLKLGYLCRTVRPDLAALASQRADDPCATPFCTIYSVDNAIFNSGESAENRFVPARVRLSMCWAAASVVICHQLGHHGHCSGVFCRCQNGLADGQPVVPCLRALAAANLLVAALLLADGCPSVALTYFCSQPAPGFAAQDLPRLQSCHLRRLSLLSCAPLTLRAPSCVVATAGSAQCRICTSAVSAGSAQCASSFATSASLASWLTWLMRASSRKLWVDLTVMARRSTGRGRRPRRVPLSAVLWGFLQRPSADMAGCVPKRAAASFGLISLWYAPCSYPL